MSFKPCFQSELAALQQGHHPTGGDVPQNADAKGC
jgi:hypothetical protein